MSLTDSHLVAIKEAFDNKRLFLILLPTEKCNFRCTYCYEDFKIGSMKRSVINGVKNYISTRIDNLNDLKIAWFGGEPMLAMDVIREISHHIQTLIPKNREFSYYGEMTTNGHFLNIDAFTELISLGVKAYQISLDGYKEGHNKTRITKTGEGTFDKIWENLLAFKNSTLDAQITLRLHFTPQNVEDLEVLIEAINENFSDDPRFEVLFHSVDPLGGPNNSVISKMTGEEKLLIKSRLTKRLKNKNSLNSLNSETNKLIQVCYASKPNSYLVRANGRLGKCTVALNDEMNNIGYLTEEGKMVLTSERYKIWLKGFENMNEKALGCPFGNMNTLLKMAQNLSLNEVPA